MRDSRRDVRRQYWQLIRSGCLRAEAAAQMGLDEATGKRWFRQAGGVVPAFVRVQPSGRYLSFAEREEIFAGVQREEPIRQIARRLGRPPSTVQRELRRNMRYRYRSRSRLDGGPGRPRLRPWDYRPSKAQLRTDLRGSRPKPAKLATNQRLRELVQFKLTERLSPKQIAAELRQEFPDNPEMWVSHETIYQSIYVQGRGALRRELAVCLRTATQAEAEGRRASGPDPRHGEHQRAAGRGRGPRGARPLGG